MGILQRIKHFKYYSLECHNIKFNRLDKKEVSIEISETCYGLSKIKPFIDLLTFGLIP